MTRSSAPIRPPVDRARALAPASAAAIVGAALLFFLAGPLGVTSGLLVVGAAVGWVVGLAARTGDPGGSAGRRVATGVGLALGAIVVAWLATWGWALAEGGALGPLDFLAQVYGPLVPAQAIFVVLAAMLGSR